MSGISNVGKLHMSGPKGRKRWRVKYWLDDEPDARTHYLARAEGTGRLGRRDAERLLSRWQQDVGREPGRAHKVKLPTLREYTDRYVASIRPRYKATSLTAIQHTIRYMLDCLKEDRRINQVTPEVADRFFEYLMANDLAEATLKHHLDNARGVFKAAIGTYPDHLRVNPFGHIRIKPEPGQGTWKYVPYKDALAAVNACTDEYTSRIGWQVFIALQRFGGLRKGEAIVLTKQAVDLTQDPMVIKVDCSKTARSKGERYRIVPVLFPVLGDLLVRAIGESGPAERLVVNQSVARGKGAQRNTLLRILKRSGLEPWKPTYQVLRASCEYDFLKLGLPEAVYTQAIGHSPEVSRRYYLAKFQGADLDEFTRDEFRDAANRVKELISA